ncbi:MAG: phosphoribosylamine--glycine ligase [Micavibrio aeruginosavorus]|uniref:Phosphoribosylamine--glycine ligase n=1 Tax=Micavibrio aeruginosavorus TaxID=349221 RepID=A0A2W5A161_9BACT|nr:MAG: phosphoribosylamine--glycine ligase [Micavibrio aeruginosavorus]
MKVLLVGSGGREHAMAWKIAQSPDCTKLYAVPGNPGIAEVAECAPIAVDDIAGIVAFAKDKAVDLVVIGPEGPLVAGIADALAAENIAVFGPSKAAARLEGSKAFTKDMCTRHNIPTAAYGRFTDAGMAAEFIRKTGAPIVVKADGLAAGKGVIIAQTVDEAIDAANDMLSGNSFGAAGNEIVVEEFMDGEEVSFFALADGKTVVPFASAQDHKRVGDGDVGPNTGGMGAYSPAYLVDDLLQQKIMERIILPTVRGMAADGCPFQGVLFAGLMIVKGEPMLIEYNTRFGDPECQVMLPRLQDDFLSILNACAKGELSQYQGGLSFSKDEVLGVVMAAKGYPASYAKGGKIEGIAKADALKGVKVFHAGTAKNGYDVVASGGRVLTVTAIADDIGKAQQNAYEAVGRIVWEDGFCRRDIGWRAVAAAKGKAA